MNILVISQYYYPEQFRIIDICESLQKKGHNVTVVTGIPNYPKGEVFPGYEDSYLKPEIYNGVTIIRCNNRPRHKGIKNLALNYLSFVIEANKAIGKIKSLFDVVYVYQLSPITLAIPAIKFAKKRKIPMYLYCLDLWPESFRDMSDKKLISVKNPVFLLVKLISKWIYRKADCLGVKCNEFIDYLVETCDVNRTKCRLLYEHAESNYLEVTDKPLDNGCVDFMFLGNIGHSSNCIVILKAVELLKETNPYMIHFVGEGSGLEELRLYVKIHNLEKNIVFHGRYPQSEIINFYEYADVCLLTLSNRTAVGLTPPAKLAGYMAASRPIVGAINGASKTIVNDAGCGFIVDYDDIEGLANYMQNIIDNPHILDGLGEKGRIYFSNNFALETHICNLENQLLELIGDE